MTAAKIQVMKIQVTVMAVAAAAVVEARKRCRVHTYGDICASVGRRSFAASTGIKERAQTTHDTRQSATPLAIAEQMLTCRPHIQHGIRVSRNVIVLEGQPRHSASADNIGPDTEGDEEDDEYRATGYGVNALAAEGAHNAGTPPASTSAFTQPQ